MVLRIDRGSQGRCLVLRLSGRLQSDHVEQLRAQIEGSPQGVVLDLSDVKLVDRDVVCFLGACEANGTELRHCSAYIRDWILREKASQEKFTGNRSKETNLSSPSKARGGHMQIGIVGSGAVAQTIGKRLIELGHNVTLGTRSPTEINSKSSGAALRAWAERAGSKGRIETFEGAAAGEMIINATQGTASIAALSQAGEDNLAGKILIDLANQLDTSSGIPRTLATDHESLAEKIQQAFPRTRVVKTLNTVTASLMLNPRQLASADHTIFVCGNEANAKAAVSDLLRNAGWTDIVDLGDISAARGTEMLMSLWLRLWVAFGDTNFNFKVVRKPNVAPR